MNVGTILTSALCAAALIAASVTASIGAARAEDLATYALTLGYMDQPTGLELVAYCGTILAMLALMQATGMSTRGPRAIS